MDLKNLDIEFLLDKSGSMTQCDCPGGKSRWVSAQETTLALATLAEKYDPDGITVVPFNNAFKVHEGVTATKVDQIFKEHVPMQSTDTAAALRDRLDAHFARRAAGGTKSTCLLVMTDGEPNDRTAVADAIVEATKKMTADEELAISFVQVGHDAEAAKFLQWLDDDLIGRGAKFDIVDTVNIEAITDIESLLQKAFAD